MCMLLFLYAVLYAKLNLEALLCRAEVIVKDESDKDC